MSYTWDASARRYRDGSGRFVPQSVVRSMMDQLWQGGRRENMKLTRQFVRGEIGADEWNKGMRSIVKGIHSAAAVFMRGGFLNMTRSDWGFVGSRVKAQYRFVDRFEGDITHTLEDLPADADLPEGAMLQRAGMYSDAGRGTMQQMGRRVARQSGLTEERRILRPGAEHCTDCKEAAAAGWQEIGTLPVIGDSACVTNCECEFGYR
jgi:hypothetical protein